MDTFTSLLAGVTVFAILGSLAHRSGIPVDQVVQDGAGLAFISYPDAIAQFDFAPQVNFITAIRHILLLISELSILYNYIPALRRAILPNAIHAGRGFRDFLNGRPNYNSV